ncbi:GcrA family cell cycle regulator [Aureimonas leprariae]|uniref:GcrA cell cycle regulator n=1 Tax=Plantimonas leprariae TaxID=2615207 RepID=A0A7V7PL08_9HYPH|nr:GcrA family cell cycle regulator [Aureimonas leprariae]KAB0676576.1 GcrA cell cycle regulator [Aureimonas leprariae]
MSWTDERVELLTKLWGDGLSASQIAGQLGGVTRNAVIGKVHRLKLETRVKTLGGAEIVREETVEIETEVEVAGAQIVQIHAAMRSVPRVAAGMNAATAFKLEEPDLPDLAPEVPVDPRRPSGEVVPIARNLTLVQLTERTCKWPLGDPLSPDFRFCGNHSDESSPYCQYHARIAFQPSSERRRLR